MVSSARFWSRQQASGHYIPLASFQFPRGLCRCSSFRIVIAARTILAWQTIISREKSAQDPGVITVGTIHGGTKNNIIPDDVKLQLTVRSYKDDVRKHLLAARSRPPSRMRPMSSASSSSTDCSTCACFTLLRRPQLQQQTPQSRLLTARLKRKLGARFGGLLKVLLSP